jgi:hypothetical protein
MPMQVPASWDRLIRRGAMGPRGLPLPSAEQISAHLPAMTGALVIAEVLYKFHSFTLECVAFLGTWYILHLPARAIATRLLARPWP